MTALPPIDNSLLPAEVRDGSASDKKSYQAALGFERVLLGELTRVMADTANPAGGDDSQPEDAASSMYMQMLPDQLADAVTANGGIGLAQSLYQSIKERS